MLDIKISVEEGIERFELEGDGMDIMKELTFVVGQVYRQIHRGNPAAEGFKLAMQVAVVGQDSPVWKKDGALPGTVIVMPRIKKEES